jgi:hypothetical protein
MFSDREYVYELAQGQEAVQFVLAACLPYVLVRLACSPRSVVVRMSSPGRQGENFNKVWVFQIKKEANVMKH